MSKEVHNYQSYCDRLKSILDKHKDALSIDCLSEFKAYLQDHLNTEQLKLYRYSNADYFNLRNFETGKLRLTNNGVLNDVFEGLPQGIDDFQAQQLSDLVYMKCFSESPQNILMWAYYADSNKGFCVEYSIDLINDDYALEHIFPVLYEEIRTIFA